MNYNELIETISLIVENEKISKKGLSLCYELNEKQHNEMNEVVFYKTNPYTNEVFKPADDFEIMIGGILVKFKKIQ